MPNPRIEVLSRGEQHDELRTAVDRLGGVVKERNRKAASSGLFGTLVGLGPGMVFIAPAAARFVRRVTPDIEPGAATSWGAMAGLLTAIVAGGAATGYSKLLLRGEVKKATDGVWTAVTARGGLGTPLPNRTTHNIVIGPDMEIHLVPKRNWKSVVDAIRSIAAKRRVTGKK